MIVAPSIAKYLSMEKESQKARVPRKPRRLSKAEKMPPVQAVLHWFGDNTLPFVALTFVLVISFRSIFLETKDLPSLPPDQRFGYGSLVDIFQEWSEAQRQAYIRSSSIDLFPFMQCYTLWLGALLVRVKPNYFWLPLVVLAFDFVETYIPCWACQEYPRPIGSFWNVLSSLSNQGKWLFLSATIASLLHGWYQKRNASKLVDAKPY